MSAIASMIYLYLDIKYRKSVPLTFLRIIVRLVETVLLILIGIRSVGELRSIDIFLCWLLQLGFMLQMSDFLDHPPSLSGSTDEVVMSLIVSMVVIGHAVFYPFIIVKNFQASPHLSKSSRLQSLNKSLTSSIQFFAINLAGYAIVMTWASNSTPIVS
jgi:hypothetical protein